jgi:hypothetical protein
LKTADASNGVDPAGGPEEAALVRAVAEISSTRAKVARSVLELQRELARTVDWRRWVRRKPVLAVSLAFGLGFVLGRRV